MYVEADVVVTSMYCKKEEEEGDKCIGSGVHMHNRESTSKEEYEYTVRG